MYSSTLGMARVFAVACILSLAACTQPSAPAPKPADTRAANEASVRAAVESFKSAISRRNVDGILSFYASDGWQLPQNGPIARTDEERRTLWKALAGLPIAQDAVDVADRIDLADSGDLAVQYGEFRQVMVDGKGNFKSLPQKFITSWRKQPDGSWKITASMATVEN
jgi:ketosteroid isomerase-like protein